MSRFLKKAWITESHLAEDNYTLTMESMNPDDILELNIHENSFPAPENVTEDNPRRHVVVIHSLSSADLLVLHSRIFMELKKRGIVE